MDGGRLSEAGATTGIGFVVVIFGTIRIRMVILVDEMIRCFMNQVMFGFIVKMVVSAKANGCGEHLYALLWLVYILVQHKWKM